MGFTESPDKEAFEGHLAGFYMYPGLSRHTTKKVQDDRKALPGLSLKKAMLIGLKAALLLRLAANHDPLTVPHGEAKPVEAEPQQESPVS